MFTGIVEELGTIRSIQVKPQGATLEIQATDVLSDAKVGDSISVDGACLTIRFLTSETFTVDVSAETLRRTTLGERKIGEQVNLERPLRLSDRLGGHLVLGHVDEVATIRSWKDEGDASVMQVTMSRTTKPYIAYKGSITIDGVSLTVSNLLADAFEVTLIPHTKDVTTFGTKRNGAKVNLEVDIVARYLETLLKNTEDKKEWVKQSASETLDLNFLAKHGYIE
ncbi:riboflavin synthase [Candidatus Poribacteria bacterium]|nr:riboflavin synthase [Candidatus Poribacteria bacterium]MYA58635.1 riboflavin synthase [Candidatus Poribacteria bacterium]